MLFDVVRCEANAVAPPSVVVVHHVQSGAFQAFLDAVGTSQAGLKAQEALLGPEGHEIARLTIPGEADIELVVLEFEGGVDLAKQPRKPSSLELLREQSNGNGINRRGTGRCFAIHLDQKLITREQGAVFSSSRQLHIVPSSIVKRLYVQKASGKESVHPPPKQLRAKKMDIDDRAKPLSSKSGRDTGSKVRDHRYQSAGDGSRCLEIRDGRQRIFVEVNAIYVESSNCERQGISAAPARRIEDWAWSRARNEVYVFLQRRRRLDVGRMLWHRSLRTQCSPQSTVNFSHPVVPAVVR